MAKASFQPAHLCEKTTQKPRSHTPRRRRRSPRVLVSTPACCRRARFSTASSRCVLSDDLAASRRVHTKVHTALKVLVPSRGSRAFRADDVFSKHSHFADKAPGPGVLAELVARLISSRDPPLRSRITREASVFRFLRWLLPASAFEAGTRRGFNLDRDGF